MTTLTTRLLLATRLLVISEPAMYDVIGQLVRHFAERDSLSADEMARMVDEAEAVTKP